MDDPDKAAEISRLRADLAESDRLRQVALELRVEARDENKRLRAELADAKYTASVVLENQNAEIVRLRAELVKAHGLANDLLHAGRRDAEEIARLRDKLAFL